MVNKLFYMRCYWYLLCTRPTYWYGFE